MFCAFVMCVGCLSAAQLFAAEEEPTIRRAEEVIEAFQSNHAAVDEEYLEKTVYVTGEVLRVVRTDRKDKGDPEYVVHVAGAGMYLLPTAPPGVSTLTPAAPRYSSAPAAPAVATHLEFRFVAKHRAQLAELRRGRTVTFEAVCQGESDEAGNLAIRFDNSKIIKVHESPSPADEFVPRGGSAPSPYAPRAPDFGPMPPVALPPRF
jgi:hypothetical protein